MITNSDMFDVSQKHMDKLSCKLDDLAGMLRPSVSEKTVSSRGSAASLKTFPSSR